ncbi:MAG TPA: hypothetical protein VGN57_08775 [Pirellulaceae bacterium]|nr:hypothetical protein [Pirellulaceae bacterium]
MNDAGSPPQASQFVLSFIRQRLLLPNALQRLEARLREFAAAEATVAPDDAELDRLKPVRRDLAEQIALAQKNLARAKSDEQYAAVAAE